MKKITLLAAFIFAAFFTQAQDSDSGLEIGLKVSPGLAMSRVNDPGPNNFDNSNVKFRGSFGLILDYFFGKNYAFSSGLEYGVKGGTITYGTTTTTKDELNI